MSSTNQDGVALAGAGRTTAGRRNAILCALLIAFCVFLANPSATVPFGDDFSYTRTALDFARTGHIVYNGWATAMLGWQVVWGALFIKLFGFSFTVVRLSAVPLAMASVYLFHQILVRFGIGPRNAILGCLTLGLSPLFFLISTTYLTDVPGVLVVLVCLAMCQRAIDAEGSNKAIVWLVLAGLVNLLGGTVRQTSWLGVLVMVPSTAWLLRKQRGMLRVGAVTTLVGAFGVVASMHWAGSQPFFVKDPILIYPRDVFFLSVFGEYIKAFLCFVLVLTPIAVAWIPGRRGLSRKQWLALGVILSFLGAAFAIHLRNGTPAKWLAPWLVSFLQVQTSNIPLWFRYAVSIFVSLMGILVTAHIAARLRKRSTRSLIESPRWKSAVWLVCPFSAAYLLALLPRAETTVIQDRYLLVLMPGAIILLLVLYEAWLSPRLPNLSIAVLCLFAAFAIAAAHDFYADLRAGETATQEALAGGIPRTSILEGFASDLWVQLEVDGYVNSWNMVSASKNYNPHVAPWPFPPGCVDASERQFEPAIQPRYVVSYGLSPCLVQTQYPPVSFRMWLPPFHGTRTVARILTVSEIAR